MVLVSLNSVVVCATVMIGVVVVPIGCTAVLVAVDVLSCAGVKVAMERQRMPHTLNLCASLLVFGVF